MVLGRFLGSTHHRPEKAIDKIIERNPHLKSLSIPLTVTVTGDYEWEHSAVTVTAECINQEGHKSDIVAGIVANKCTTRTRKIIVNTWDIFGVYQIAIVSDLPRAKEFLQKFPEFLQAFHNRAIMPPPIGDIEPKIIAFQCVPHNKRGEYVESVCAQEGWSSGKFYNLFNKAKATIGLKPFEMSEDVSAAVLEIRTMPFGKKRRQKIVLLAERWGMSEGYIYKLANGKEIKPRASRKDKGTTKHPGEREKVIEFFMANREKFEKHGNRFKELPQKAIKEMLNLQANQATINCWIRSHKVNFN